MSEVWVECPKLEHTTLPNTLSTTALIGDFSTRNFYPESRGKETVLGKPQKKFYF